LTELLKNDDEGSRNSACIALGKIGPAAKAALPALRVALSDKSQDVRRFAAEAIQRIEQSRGPAPITDRDAYAIYSAHLARTEPDRRVPPAPLIIQTDTENWDQRGCIQEPFKTEWQEVVADYRRKNAKVWTIQRRLRLKLNMTYEFVSKAALLATFGSQGNWSEFDRIHPGSGGYMSFSAIGFNADKTRAMLQSTYHCGVLCGHGGFFFFEKVNGRWMGTVPMNTCVMDS
jgi:HEAT repeat protein